MPLMPEAQQPKQGRSVEEKKEISKIKDALDIRYEKGRRWKETSSLDC